MPSNDQVFEMIAERRRALADSLDGVTPQQGAVPSLCAGWTVHQVAAHLVMPFRVGLPTVVLGLIKNRGNFDRYSNSWAIAMAAGTPLAEIAALLREHAEHRFTPPGFGPQAPLTDVCVHGFDIGMPLGAPPEVPTDQIDVVLDLLTTPRRRSRSPGPACWTVCRCRRPTARGRTARA